MKPNKSKTVCFTGHRPKGILADNPYDEANRPKYKKIVDRLIPVIENLINTEYTNSTIIKGQSRLRRPGETAKLSLVHCIRH